MLLELSSNIPVGGAYRLDIVGILGILSCQGRPVFDDRVSGDVSRRWLSPMCSRWPTYSQPVVVAVILSEPVVEGS
jgi:hypothetical protein